MSTVANSGDGLSRMVQNPKRYFAEARARAAAQVDAEMKRDRRRSAAERNGAADPDQR
ncbi:MAG TPA: hypothetical protein VF642_11680 [Propionibacteriaceae bacterium]|jgi:hypothetical protein